MTREKPGACTATDPQLGQALLVLQQAGEKMASRQWAAAAGLRPADCATIAARLRALGAELQGSESEGWRLASQPDLLLAEILEPKIVTTIFSGGVHHFARIDSTNAAAMRAGAEGWARRAAENSFGERALDDRRQDGVARKSESRPVAPRGEVWLAEEQSSGRGRAGHVWHSQPGDGIYLSALLWPLLPPSEVLILSLAAGLAVVEAVHEATGVWGDLRWPNDVMLGGRKFCGILTEMNAGLERARYVVVGVGLNANHAQLPPELEPIATSLRRELGHRVSRVELVAALLRVLDREFAALDPFGIRAAGEHGSVERAAGERISADGARQSILRRFERHSSFCCGAEVTVEEAGGYQGVTRGLDERGFLRVETDEGVRTVLSGGVRKR